MVGAGLVDARPAQDKRKGADSGIDGYINFFDDNRKAKRVIVQVKSGNVGVSQIRDLKGVLEREKTPIGVFITLKDPTGPMLREAISAGVYEPQLYPSISSPVCRSSPLKSSWAARRPSTRASRPKRRIDARRDDTAMAAKRASAT